MLYELFGITSYIVDDAINAATVHASEGLIKTRPFGVFDYSVIPPLTGHVDTSK